MMEYTKGILKTLGVIVGILFILQITTMTNFGASKGTHTGYITAIEYNSNIIFPATLVYFKSNPENTQEDIYCIEDNPKLKAMLEEISKNREMTTIAFQNNFIMWRWQCNGGQSIIQSIWTKEEEE